MEMSKPMNHEGESCWSEKFGCIMKKDCIVCSGDSSISKEAYITLDHHQHGNDLVKGFCKQRSQGRYLDCIVQLDSGTISANKSILSSFSEYLRALFQYTDHAQTQPKSDDQPLQSTQLESSIIMLDHLNSSSVAALIDCAYSSHLLVTCHGMQGLLNAVEFLCVTSIEKSTPHEHILFNAGAFLTKLTRDLCEQRARGEFVDCVVPIGSLKITAHQSVLCAFSVYFDERCLNSGHLELENNEYFQSLLPSTVEALVNFAYTGKITIPSCAVLELLRAADYLGFKRVSDLSREYVDSRLTVDNCLLMHENAVSSKNEILEKAVESYVLRNFYAVLLKQEFLDLDVSTVLKFLEANELTMMRLHRYDDKTEKYFFIPPNEQEELLYERVIKYVEYHGLSDREQHLPRLLSRGVRLPLVDLSKLLWLRMNYFLEDRSEALEVVKKAMELNTNKGINVNLSAQFSPHWMEVRRSTRLRLLCMMANGRAQPSSCQGIAFDDSEAFNLPVQYVTGLKMYIRQYNNLYILSGLHVTYNGGYSVSHGVDQDQSQFPVTSFHFKDRNERITGILCETRNPESHLIHVFGCVTNMGQRRGYGVDGRYNSAIRKPDGSLYLAYLTGSVDVIDGKPTLRDVGFVWAIDKNNREKL